jgi:type I restriction enzyme, R subunit
MDRSLEERERKTRRDRVDPKPRRLGWEIVPFGSSRPLGSYAHHALTEYPTADGPADYALCVGGRILG